jgi:hypothetical protein
VNGAYNDGSTTLTNSILGCVQQTFIHLTFNQNRKKSILFYYASLM